MPRKAFQSGKGATVVAVTHEWVSVREAGRMLGWGRHRLLHRALLGDFQTMHIAGRTLLLRSDVERAAAAATNVGQPREAIE